jgi:hypothetical protein
MAISCQLVAAVLNTAKVYVLSSGDLNLPCLVNRYRLLISVVSPIQRLDLAVPFAGAAIIFQGRQ